MLLLFKDSWLEKEKDDTDDHPSWVVCGGRRGSHEPKAARKAPWTCNWEILTSFANYLFIYFWLFCVSVAAHGLSLVLASGGYSLVMVQGLLITVASLIVEHVGLA